MLRWLRGAGARPAAVAAMQNRINDALWSKLLRTYAFLDLPSTDERTRLRERTAWVLASKTLNAAGGLVLTDHMRLAIAAQAALPILNLPVTLYEGWSEIIVYPDGFRVARSYEDEIGVVHETIEDAAGEAWDGGPVVLSWEDPELGKNKRAISTHAYNVVIHEFAHKLDVQADGNANGQPALHRHPELAAARWHEVLADSFARFVLALERVEDSIPTHFDPESPDADPWYARLPMDPYAASDEGEFFAVSSETFFTAPTPLARDLPQWYGLLAAYYRQDPLARGRTPAHPTAALTTISTL